MTSSSEILSRDGSGMKREKMVKKEPLLFQNEPYPTYRTLLDEIVSLIPIYERI